MPLTRVSFRCPRCDLDTSLLKAFVGMFECANCGHWYRRTRIYALPPGFEDAEVEDATTVAAQHSGYDE